MALNLPIVNGSSGVWGTMLNVALTDLDGRTLTAKGTNDTQDTDIGSLKTRVAALEAKPATQGMLLLATSSTRPPAVAGQIVLETDTGYLYNVQNVSGVPTRLPWPGSYVAKIKQTISQNLPTGGATGTGITMDSRDFDRLGGWNGTSRYTCMVKGAYEFTGGVSFAGNTTGYRSCMWAVDGTIQNSTRTALDPVNSASAATVLNARSVVMSLNVGSYVELQGWQSSGGTLATDVLAMNQSSMTVKYLGYVGT